jgi:hypothetical protein
VKAAFFTTHHSTTHHSPTHTCFFCSLMTTASGKLGDVPPTVPT